MSKINAVRFINLNYNNNSNKIEDETMILDGDSTLLSLANGGGKTVLVQMMLAPFVRKRYRNTTDRTFESFFTSNQPTILLVEWILDGGAGFVLTGMIVRKKQAGDDTEAAEDLEIISFIHEYREKNEYDLHSIPFVEKGPKQKKLIGFASCRRLMEEARQSKGIRFDSYDMAQSMRQRQYFQKLREYGIHSQEWESIIKKINIKESGLSELFKEAKDEAGLVEKWFLPAIETKLNKEEDRIWQFKTMMMKFIRQYKENEVKIRQKKVILSFRQETEVIEHTAVDCEGIRIETENRLDQIAYLREQIEQLLKDAMKKEFTAQVRLEDLDTKLQRVQYEEISYRIYQLLDTLDSLSYEQNRVGEQRERQQSLSAQVEKELHVLECARLLEDLKESEMEAERHRLKMELSRKEEEDLLPERINLGYTLKINYTDKKAGNDQKRMTLGQQYKDLEAEKSTIFIQLDTSDRQRAVHLEELGHLKAARNQYLELEASFNQKYQCRLERNILDRYEEGTIEGMELDLNKKLDKRRSQIQADNVRRQKLENVREEIIRNTLETTTLQTQLNGQYKNLEHRQDHYQKELEQREKYLQYLSIPKEKKYETEMILEQFAEKNAILRTELNTLERELLKNRDEHQKLKNGVVFDLPESFSQLLHSLDITFLTGMEYLKNNRQTEAENQELVRKIPILPYSILVSEKELSRLSKEQSSFFTSVPIPILVKERLNQFQERKDCSIYSEGEIHFFILFNHQLLNAQGLKQLLTKKEEQIHLLEDKMDRRQQELQFYEGMLSDIRHQEVSLDKMQLLTQELEYTQESMAEKSSLLLTLRTSKTDNDTDIRNILEKIRKETNALNQEELMMEEFQNLKVKYQNYTINGNSITKLQDQLRKLQEDTELLNAEVERLNGRLSTNRMELSYAQQEAGEIAARLLKYAAYETGEFQGDDLAKNETRYTVVTEGVSSELKYLESAFEEAQNRLQKSRLKLDEKVDKYQLLQEEYHSAVYSKMQEQELDSKLLSIQQKISSLTDEWNRLEKEAAVTDSQIKREREELKSKCEKEEPVPKSQITDIQFQLRYRVLKQSREEEKKLFTTYKELRTGYEANMSALSEFSNKKSGQEYSFQEKLQILQKNSLAELSRNELEEMYGNMIREYRSSVRTLEKKYIELEKCVDSVLAIPQFAEEFYRQPLQLLKNLCEKPKELQHQLNVTLRSFQILLDKLEVDIQFIDREEEKLEQLLFDYVIEIHKNLEKIDRNSTISVKDRPIKMLRIQTPSWEENKEIYAQRMASFVKELILAGMQCIEENQNLEEMLGLRMTTKALYDAVPGIASTGIRLYKIEAQREYPITWAEVSKNSGGEGFLSAFVVLACLLSYMRRDESELMIEREEGKVIIMDNPFAQTNASHLLIPLMDIAKKSNTQLICLTGLGGESIYNRFDNIYVLNLIESGLQSSVQYLKVEQVKGDAKIYEMSTSRILVEDSEQMELLF